MAATVYNCVSMTGPASFTISGAGKLLGFLASHDQAAVQTITFYNNATPGTPADEILVIDLQPEQSPCFVMFPRDMPLSFDTGLSIAATNCEVSIWAVKFS